MSVSDLVNADPAEVAAVTGQTTDEAAKSINSASRLLRKVARSTAKEIKAKKVFAKEEVNEIDIAMIADEVGLSGEIRATPSGLERIRQAAQQGFCHCICPKANVPKKLPLGIKVYGVDTLAEAIDALDNID